MVGIEFVLWTICFVCFRHIYCSCDDPRIVGGILAKPGEFKSQVAITGDGLALPKSPVCGGVLIGPVTVLTAAQCISFSGAPPKCDQLEVFGDDLDASHTQPTENRQTRKVAWCAVHPDFKVFNYPENNIAVLVVDKPFTETDTFKPTKLDFGNSKPVEDEQCRIAGWGIADDSNPNEVITSFKLMAVNMTVIPLDICNDYYKGFLPPKVFCAGQYYTTAGICYADNGGALICNDIIKGVASFRIDCSSSNPGVFVELDHYMHWIDENFSGSDVSSQVICKLISICLIVIELYTSFYGG